jgi:hypothetical protein
MQRPTRGGKGGRAAAKANARLSEAGVPACSLTWYAAAGRDRHIYWRALAQ